VQAGSYRQSPEAPGPLQVHLPPNPRQRRACTVGGMVAPTPQGCCGKYARHPRLRLGWRSSSPPARSSRSAPARSRRLGYQLERSSSGCEVPWDHHPVTLAICQARKMARSGRLRHLRRRQCVPAHSASLCAVRGRADDSTAYARSTRPSTPSPGRGLRCAYRGGRRPQGRGRGDDRGREGCESIGAVGLAAIR
jgi:hypothetical protein